jgi:hypothetical protein
MPAANTAPALRWARPLTPALDAELDLDALDPDDPRRTRKFLRDGERL